MISQNINNKINIVSLNVQLIFKFNKFKRIYDIFQRYKILKLFEKCRFFIKRFFLNINYDLLRRRFE